MDQSSSWLETVTWSSHLPSDAESYPTLRDGDDLFYLVAIRLWQWGMFHRSILKLFCIPPRSSWRSWADSTPTSVFIKMPWSMVHVLDEPLVIDLPLEVDLFLEYDFCWWQRRPGDRWRLLETLSLDHDLSLLCLVWPALLLLIKVVVGDLMN